MPWYLGIEIGGTKLQLGVGSGDGTEWAAFERYDVNIGGGAAGILAQIEQAATALRRRFEIARIGVGFGGPVDAAAGRVRKSHQVAGWDDVALGPWLTERLGVPVRLGNDCDVAALAEARYGAGRGREPVFYVTVGTGVGGGLVSGGRVFGAGRPAIAEIGHLRPGPAAGQPANSVESIASGLGIAAAARGYLRGALPPAWEPVWFGMAGPDSAIEALPPRWLATAGASLPPVGRGSPTPPQTQADRDDLLQRVGGDPDRVTAKLVAEAAAAGNGTAVALLQAASGVLGWAIAQVITVVAPEVVVVGGGVPLCGEALFFAPLRRAVERYVFPPLAGSYEIVPAALGEAVVVHGAVALAAA